VRVPPEIIDEVRHDMGGAGLACELEVLTG